MKLKRNMKTVDKLGRDIQKELYKWFQLEHLSDWYYNKQDVTRCHWNKEKLQNTQGVCDISKIAHLG